jgi:hypothetical protein
MIKKTGAWNPKVGVAGVVTVLLASGAGWGLASCKDPFAPSESPVGGADGSVGGEASAGGQTINEDCPAPALWFGDGGTPPVLQETPAPHPDTECPFYRGAYQNFLIATQPLPSGDPALVDFPTIDDAFTSITPHPQRNTPGWAWLGAVRQAGYRNVLVDQDDHTLYYGIHMNQAFVDFIKANNLQTVGGVLNVDPLLSFPPGLVEYKTAWKDIDKQDFPGGQVTPPGGGDPGDYSTYITTMAYLPTLSQDPMTGVVAENAGQTRLRKVALLAIHSVYTLPGHPEFIWGSVQHVNLNAVDHTATAVQGTPIYGVADCQPDTLALPVTDAGPPGSVAQQEGLDNSEVDAALSDASFVLYKANTPENQCNSPASNLLLDVDAQSFPGQAESVYRMYPGSKSQQIGPDTAIISLNSNLTGIANELIEAGTPDKRLYYHVVAAIWMDKPSFFGLGPNDAGITIQNDDGTNPLVLAAMADPDGGLFPSVNEGVFCGTPLGPDGGSGDKPGTMNTVPGCVTRLDVVTGGPTNTDQGVMNLPTNNPSMAIAMDLAASGTDSPFSILGGEDRLSSTSMETFTQSASSFPNCFECHNTQPVADQGISVAREGPGAPTTQVILAKPAMINVSHLFSEFLLRELTAHPGLLNQAGQCAPGMDALCGAPSGVTDGGTSADGGI